MIDAEKMVSEIMESDLGIMEKDWQDLMNKLPVKGSDDMMKMLKASFAAGFSSGSVQTIKTFMEKVLPAVLNEKKS